MYRVRNKYVVQGNRRKTKMGKMIISKIIHTVIEGERPEVIMIEERNDQMKSPKNEGCEKHPPFEIEGMRIGFQFRGVRSK